MTSARQRAGVVGAVTGLVAAGLGAGLAAERLVVGRSRLRPDPDAGEPFGGLRGRERPVTADDGVVLHAEEHGDPGAPLTIVLVHGYVLDLGCWHYQVRDLAGDPAVRVVVYDQRGHGRSAKGPREHATIDGLGADLRCVLEQLVPTGPVVLAGHSMGGMTVMALADAHPELFGERVVGVALLSTSPGKLAEVTLGVPARLARVARPVTSRALVELGRRPTPVEQLRRVGSDLGFLLTKRYAFGGPVSPSLVAYVESMVAATPIDVIADLWPTFGDHDKLAALDVLHGVQTLVLVGSADIVTPPDHSRAIVAAVPEAELVIVPGAGHCVMLERPELVSAQLRALCERGARSGGTASA